MGHILDIDKQLKRYKGRKKSNEKKKADSKLRTARDGRNAAPGKTNGSAKAFNERMRIYLKKNH